MATTTATRLFKCLSEPLRVRLVRLLRAEELNGSELREIVQVPQSTLARHIQVLREAGLVTSRRDGSLSFYRVIEPEELPAGQGEALMELVEGLTGEDEDVAADAAALQAVLETRRAATRDHFEQFGHTWDELHRRVSDPAAGLRALSWLLPPDAVVVDAGCGSGTLLPEFSGVGAQVIAVDNAPSRLDEARQRASDLGMTNVDVREGDLDALPVGDGEADAVIAQFSLHHVSQPKLAVADMARVLRPGGVLVITDFTPHDETWLRDEHADQWLGFDPADVERWMRAAGLSVITTERRPYASAAAEADLGATMNLELFIMRGARPRDVNSKGSRS